MKQLSDKISNPSDWMTNELCVISVEDVKQFIAQLKEKVLFVNGMTGDERFKFRKLIDKLAGEKLK